jgi:hypothetical protein
MDFLGWIAILWIAILYRWNQQRPPLRECIAAPNATSSPSDVCHFLINLDTLAQAGFHRVQRPRPARHRGTFWDDDDDGGFEYNSATGFLMFGDADAAGNPDGLFGD